MLMRTQGLVGGGLEGCHLMHHLRLSNNRLGAWPTAAVAAMPLLHHADLSCNAIERLCVSASDGAGSLESDGSGGGAAERPLLLPPSLQVRAIESVAVGSDWW